MSPPTKRIKLETPSLPVHEVQEPASVEDHEAEHCSICLQPYADRAVVPTCSHEFCLDCLLIWTEKSRRCPLCSQDVGKYLIHNIRSKYDYQKRYLTPLPASTPSHDAAAVRADARRSAIRRREIEWGQRRRRQLQVADQLGRAVEKRKWIYRHNLYAKHVASNPYTRYRPFPTPAQFAASQDHISRATLFIRRELMVWVGLDVEFLTTFTVSLMKSLDIRSEPAIRLLSEFLDMDADVHEGANAEHFAHELYSYLRSPYRDLSAYDSNVQYDVPHDVPPPDARARHSRRSRWSPSRSRSRTRSRPRNDDAPQRLQPRTGRRPASRSPSRGRAYRSIPSPRRSPRRREASARSSRQDPDSDTSEPSHRRRSPSREDVPRSSPDGGHLAEHGYASERDAKGDRRNRYDGKGKARADDDSAASSPSLQGSSVAIGRDVVASMRSASRGKSDILNDQDSLAASVSLVTSRDTHPIAATAHSADIDMVSVANPHIACDGRVYSVASTGDGDGEGVQPFLAPRQERPPVRIRRNALHTIQEYLAGSGRGIKVNANASAPELVSPTKSPRSQASLTHDRALRPGDPSLSGDNVPSLLLRLSDPLLTASALPRDANVNASGGPGSRRGTLSTLPSEEGCTISAPDMIARTRVRPANTPTKGFLPPVSRSAPPIPPAGAAGSQSSGMHARGADHDHGTGWADVGAVETVERMSSEKVVDAGPTTATRAAGSGSDAQPLSSPSPSPSPSSADPRCLLLQKLELEKRRATAGPPVSTTPTAESGGVEEAETETRAPSSAAAVPGSDSALVSAPRARCPHEGRTKPAPGAEVVAAEQRAERREAELRSQARLRVRLAAAKRAAAHEQGPSEGVQTDVRAGSEGGAGSSYAEGRLDERLVSLENLLKNKLRARKG